LTRLGGTVGANCGQCPFSRHGEPRNPVCSEYPDEGAPLFLIVGEGPGLVESRMRKQLTGPPGELLLRGLLKVGVERQQIGLLKTYLCAAHDGATEYDKERAAAACKPRLMLETAKLPGVPVLTLGALAARTVIPQAALDEISPPDAVIDRKNQKNRETPEQIAKKKAAKRAKKVDKAYRRVLGGLVRAFKNRTFEAVVKRHKRKPDRAYLQREIDKVMPTLEIKALIEAGVQVDEAKAKKKAGRVKKKGKAKVTDLYSTTFEVDIDGAGARRLVPAVHPGTLLKGGGRSIGGSHTPDLAFVNLLYDLIKVKGFAQGKSLGLTFDCVTEYERPERASQLLADAVDRAFAEGQVALDLETYVEDPDRHSALQQYVAEIRAIGLATKGRSVSVLWGLLSPAAKELLAAMLASEKVCKVYHNGLYDRTVLTARGYVIAGPWEDTLLAHHAAFPGVSHKLQQVAAQFFAIAPWKSEFRNSEESPESLTLYNAKDTGSTLALVAPLTVMVKRTDTERVYALDKRMSEVATKMHLAGMPVSREVNAELLRTFSANIDQARHAIESLAYEPKTLAQIAHFLAVGQSVKARKGDPAEIDQRYAIRKADIDDEIGRGVFQWKISGAKHIAAFLQALGIALTQVTESGDVATKKSVLEGLVAEHPAVRSIIEYRENSTLLKNFVWQIFDRFDPTGRQIVYGFADGQDRIHPIWNVHRITGRWASTMPGVSNIPKEKYKKIDEETSVLVRPNLRRQIVAPKGRIFVGFDFAQLEARIIGLLSGDPFLCGIFSKGGDIHTECARVVFPRFDECDAKEKKRLRNLVKPLEYGAFYKGSTETLWKNLVKEGFKLRLVDVEMAVAKLMKRMEGVVRWQDETVIRAVRPPHVVSEFLTGRCRNFPTGNVEATEAVNFGVQSAGAAIMNTGMERMDQALARYRNAWPIIQIHDAAVFECDEDDGESVKQTVEACFTQEYRGIPFPVEAEIGRTLADV